MKKYLVGGAVRDLLMGHEPKDKDYVVVGSTIEKMLEAGFAKVGADFPVFLHPKTGEEYALARKEQSTGDGYNDFETEHGSDVTLEEDLMRRDLTINAMAMDEHGNLVDPFNGKEDLGNKVLRHVSDAFREDPVRVLRVARFRARFGGVWTVHEDTVDLSRQMGKKGMLNKLTAERVWKEMSRALMETHPRLFFDTLLEMDVLHILFPAVYRLLTATETRKWHPEGNAYEHTMLVLTQAALQNFDLETRMAALVHDFGKGITPRDKLPAHHGHEITGVKVVETFCNENTVPSAMRKNLMKVIRYHMHMHRLDAMNAKTFVHMFEDLKCEHVVHLLHRLGMCDHRGRLGSEFEDVSDLYKLVVLFDAFQSVKFDDVFPNGETNVNKIKDGLFKARVFAVKKSQ